MCHLQSAIEDLQEENERLRTACQSALNVPADWGDEVCDMRQILEAALETK
jgi:hypothetical protein